MGPPPPPPPPGPPGPPPPPLAVPFSSSKGNDRGDLLKSIRDGKSLRKMGGTSDRSAPALGSSSKKNEPSDLNGGNEPRQDVLSSSRLPGIGGLFSDGIPTLKKTKGGIRTGREDINNFGSQRNGTPLPPPPPPSSTHGVSSRMIGASTPNLCPPLNSSSSLGSSYGVAVPINSSTGSITNLHDNFNIKPPKPGRLPPKPPFLSAKHSPFLMDKTPLRHTSSTPSLPSTQPSSSLQNLPRSVFAKPNVVTAGPKPRPSNAPPPPPPSSIAASVGKKPPLRAKSFNSARTPNKHLEHRGSKDDIELEATGVGTAPLPPAPPARTLPMSTKSRRPGPAPAPPPSNNSVGKRTMKPPSQPPPPPPPSATNPPPPPHRFAIKSNGSNPPTPPTRRESMRQTGNEEESSSLEMRFASKFKPVQFLPVPEPFTGCPKTYPSRNNQPSRQGSVMKRAPAPPPPTKAEVATSSLHSTKMWAS